MDDVPSFFFQLHILRGVSLSKQIITLDASCSLLREWIIFPCAYLYRKKGFLIQKCTSWWMKRMIGNREAIRIVEHYFFIKYSCWLTLSWCNMTIFFSYLIQWDACVLDTFEMEQHRIPKDRFQSMCVMLCKLCNYEVCIWLWIPEENPSNRLEKYCSQL